jgi:predicted membrane channel-forming protein YqfA (hemolysin III family)
VSPQVFTVCLALGAAAIAMWLHARFPRMAPQALQLRFFVHVACCGIALKVAVPSALHFIASMGTVEAGLAALFAVVLPALVYSFLVTVWILKLVQNAAGSSIR